MEQDEFENLDRRDGYVKIFYKLGVMHSSIESMKVNFATLTETIKSGFIEVNTQYKELEKRQDDTDKWIANVNTKLTTLATVLSVGVSAVVFFVEHIFSRYFKG